MGSIRRERNGRYESVRLLLCAFLLWGALSSGRAVAQEGARVVGTGASATLFGGGLKASLGAAGATFGIAGASASLAQFCSGEADALLRLSPLTSSERANCTIGSIELLLGHRIYAIVVGEAAPRECLDGADRDRIFAPSAASLTVDWQQVDETLVEALPLSVWLPPNDSLEYALLDQAVSGFGLRADASAYTDAVDLATVLAEDGGALALVELGAIPPRALALGLQSGEFAGCQEAAVANVEAGTYPLAISVYLYVNRARLVEDGVSALAEAALAGALSETLTSPSEAVREINRSLLTDDSPVVSVASDSFVIPSVIGGQVRIGGAAEAGVFLSALADALATAHPSLRVSSDLRGGPAGETALCTGEIDIALSVARLSEEALLNCDSAGITVISLIPAAQAVVALSNRANAKLRCLSEERWAEIWAWPGEGAAEVWAELRLFAPPDGALATDLMMSVARGQALPIRRDVEVSADPLWRAAAVGVVEDGLSYFSWGEYQQVLAAGQQNVQAIRMGSDCLAPTEAEILAGGYPLSRPIYAHINATNLASAQLKSWLWFAFGGGNLALFSDTDLVLREGVAMRRDLLQAFADSDALAATAAQAESASEPEGEPEGEAAEGEG